MLHRSLKHHWQDLNVKSIQLEPPCLPCLGGVLSLGLDDKDNNFFSFGQFIKTLLSLPPSDHFCRRDYFNQSFIHLMVKV